MEQFEWLQLYGVYQHDNVASACNLSICDICDVGENTLFAKMYDVHSLTCALWPKCFHVRSIWGF